MKETEPNNATVDYSSGKESSEEEKIEPPKIVRIPDDDELQQMLERNHPMLDSFKLSGIKILKCSVDNFFDLLYSDEAPLPFDAFQREHVPSKNHAITKWLHGKGVLPPAASIEKAKNFDRN